jgi:hypothetical protein
VHVISLIGKGLNDIEASKLAQAFSGPLDNLDRVLLQELRETGWAGMTVPSPV